MFLCSDSYFIYCVLDKDDDEDEDEDDDDKGREGVCARWLRSKCLSSAVLSSMSDLQGALAHTGNHTHTHTHALCSVLPSGK